ncbi:MAG: ABC transporter ATP-binding protein [Deltaproteobacteria bacterium]|nr:ABC transporter ATP-binding protein [Deltaproteobacteria bacterium]
MFAGIAAVAIPVFLFFSVFLTKISGEKEIARLQNELMLANKEKSQLRDRQQENLEGMEELRIYRIEVHERNRYVRGLEERIVSMEDSPYAGPFECRQPKRESPVQQ